MFNVFFCVTAISLKKIYIFHFLKKLGQKFKVQEGSSSIVTLPLGLLNRIYGLSKNVMLLQVKMPVLNI